MSHFTTIKTRLADADVLKRALEDLGFVVGAGQVRGWRGIQTAVDVKAVKWNCEIGFRRNKDGLFEVVADWWLVGQTINQESFMRSLLQWYAYRSVREQLARQSFELQGEDRDADGTIRLRFRRGDQHEAKQTVDIKPDGATTVHVEGVPGKACLSLTAPLERLLGGEIAARRLTREADVDDGGDDDHDPPPEKERLTVRA